MVALAILKRRGGVPMLRYDSSGVAQHAAVKLDGRPIHLGDNEEGFVEVSIDELRRACRDDFDPDFVNLESGEVRRVVEKMEMWDVE